MKIEKITTKDLKKILRNYNYKRGLFYNIQITPYTKKYIYLGIDNKDFHCWIEEFKSLKKCKEWLRNG